LVGARNRTPAHPCGMTHRPPSAQPPTTKNPGPLQGYRGTGVLPDSAVCWQPSGKNQRAKNKAFPLLPTRRVGQDEGTPASLGRAGVLGHRMGAGNRRGCNATRHQTNAASSERFRPLPYASRKAASACRLRYASVWGRSEADKGAQRQPNLLALRPFNQRPDARAATPAARQRQGLFARGLSAAARASAEAWNN
jgi:hypothetical protein